GASRTCRCPMPCFRSACAWKAAAKHNWCCSGRAAATPARGPSVPASSPACAVGASDMDIAVEFLLRLLDLYPLALVDWDDLRGKYAALLGACQAVGFLSLRPQRHPVPSCPHCGKGVPSPVGGRLLCNRCLSAVDPRHLHCWQFDRRAFLYWLSGEL